MNAIVEVAIGLGFVYLLFSAVASSVIEGLSALIDRRSKSLWRSLNLILGQELRGKLLEHPAIAGIELHMESDDVNARPQPMKLWWPNRTPPNYLSPRSVALALADIGRTKPANARMKELIKTFQPEGGAKVGAEGLFRLEKWFAEQMERTSSQYKRWTQVGTLILAVVITGAFDLDTVRISSELYRNSTLRAAVADQVAEQVKGKTFKDVDASLKGFAELPIGWAPAHVSNRNWLAAVFGWLLTVLALSLGAPFWFDFVGKFVNLRLAGTKPQTDPQQFAG